MKTKNMSAKIVAGVIWLTSLGMGSTLGFAASNETVTLNRSAFNVSPGEMLSMPLDSKRYVERVLISAEGYRDSQLEIWTNGERKASAFVPGRDPHYEFTIAEVTSSIELRNVGGSTIRILTAYAVVGQRTYRDQRLRESNLGFAADIALRTRDIADQLHAGTNAQDWETYLLPIKKTAGKLYALAKARGDLSGRVGATMQTLKAQIDNAKDYLDDTLERDDQFDLAVELLAVREQIDRAMD
jgi:hypothetical protein